MIIANRPGKKASPSPQGLAQGIAVPECVARGTAILSANPKGAMHLPGREGCNFPHIFVFSSSFLFSMLNTPITPPVNRNGIFRMQRMGETLPSLLGQTQWEKGGWAISCPSSAAWKSPFLRGMLGDNFSPNHFY